jgi:hypothetical protein
MNLFAENRLPAVASTRNYAFYEAFLVALGFFAVYCSLQGEAQFFTSRRFLLPDSGLKSWNLLEGNNLTASPQFEELKLLNERLKQGKIDQQRMIVDLRGQLKLAGLLATRQKQNVETQTDNGEMMEEKMRSLQSENGDLRNQLEHANLRNGQLNIELSVSKRTMKEGEIQLRRELDDARATINAQADRIAVLGQNIYQVYNCISRVSILTVNNTGTLLYPRERDVFRTRRALNGHARVPDGEPTITNL